MTEKKAQRKPSASKACIPAAAKNPPSDKDSTDKILSQSSISRNQSNVIVLRSCRDIPFVETRENAQHLAVSIHVLLN